MQQPSTSRHLRHRRGFWLAGAAVATAVALPLFSSQVLADDDAHEGREHSRSERIARGEHQPAIAGKLAAMPKAYQTECASCHIAYAPRMLPAASWQRIMGNLKQHYGTDASLDAASVQAISGWLQANAGSAARLGAAPEQDRITRTRWFLHEHDDISAATFKRPSIKSASNCMACHTGADKGNFDEDSVRIPR